MENFNDVKQFLELMHRLDLESKIDSDEYFTMIKAYALLYAYVLTEDERNELRTTD